MTLLQFWALALRRPPCFCWLLALLPSSWEHSQVSLLIPEKECKTLRAEHLSWAQSRWTKPQLTHSCMSYIRVSLYTIDTIPLSVIQQCKAMLHLLSQLHDDQSPGWMTLHQRHWVGQNDQGRHIHVQARTRVLHPLMDSRGGRREAFLLERIQLSAITAFCIPTYCLI